MSDETPTNEKGIGHAVPPSPSVASNGNGNGATAYTDHSADVTLVSSDGRHFKVESYVLKANSTYFRHHLTTYQGTPITLQTPTKVLKVYLDLAHLRHLPSKVIWHVRDALLRLADHLGSPGIAERALFALQEHVELDPWAIFTLASQRGASGVGLAKSALRALGEKGHGAGLKVNAITPGLANGVTLPYLLGLFNAALAVKDVREGEEGDNAGWKVIADRFVPVVG